ncbi:hypothetical protein LTR78_004218 [Recurvomyces mirabilis]|uniref:Uncharacterized protein n=1 Tax=Recurvomyces mirabilis TaxID=574656 RepID=A0AAE0WQI8_9PEZI|nr:hypothetical protein LTR78_004218 [Recurvomyces mirabilis]KAK5153612.1 hypothetical protein LTS14_007306 [Recurvomyces mirabilis]
MTKHSAAVLAAMADGELWALHTIRSQEKMGSPSSSPVTSCRKVTIRADGSIELLLLDEILDSSVAQQKTMVSEPV